MQEYLQARHVDRVTCQWSVSCLRLTRHAGWLQGGVQGRVRSWVHDASHGAMVLNMKDNRWCRHVGRQHKSNGIYYLGGWRPGTSHVAVSWLSWGTLHFAVSWLSWGTLHFAVSWLSWGSSHFAISWLS